MRERARIIAFTISKVVGGIFFPLPLSLASPHRANSSLKIELIFVVNSHTHKQGLSLALEAKFF